MEHPEEPFRYCIYCQADCYQDDVEHAADCPSNTGIFPVREEDLLCPCCKETFIGISCAECKVELEEGDFYTHRRNQGPTPELLTEDDEELEVICLGCAATANLLTT